VSAGSLTYRLRYICVADLSRRVGARYSATGIYGLSTGLRRLISMNSRHQYNHSIGARAQHGAAASTRPISDPLADSRDSRFANDRIN
jgi:hypothetical protein